MLKYEPDTGRLPVLPGDVVYLVEKANGSNLVRSSKVSSVVLNSDFELKVCTSLSGYYSPQEIGDEVFLNAEEAEAWADAHRKNGPFIFENRATQWMSLGVWLPSNNGYYGVRIPAENDSGYEVVKAFYLCYSPYDDEIGFYESDRRNAGKLENVLAWIDEDYMDSLEEFDGNVLDFSYTPIEEMDLSIQAYNALKRNGMNLIRDIFKVADHNGLLEIKGMGRKAAKEILLRLEDMGFDAETLKP